MSSPLRVVASLFVLMGAALPAPAQIEIAERPWGLPRGLLAALAAGSAAHQERALGLSCVESVRHVRFRKTGTLDSERRYGYLPGGTYRGDVLPEIRFEVRSEGPVRGRVPRKVARFPSPGDWQRLFSPENHLWFMYRDFGTRAEGFDLVHVIQFRGWFPFRDGRDIREWEGIALVESLGHQLIEIRARPRNQDARLARLYDKWSQSLKITVGIFAGPWFFPFKTFRLRPPPSGYRALVRFDYRLEDLRLPSIVEYETRRAVSRDGTRPWSVSLRQYSDYVPLADSR